MEQQRIEVVGKLGSTYGIRGWLRIYSSTEQAESIFDYQPCFLKIKGEWQPAEEDSFADGLLDCPHYTRPEVLEGLTVPPVLMSGHHEEIRKWRLKQSLQRTWLRRPELLEGLALTDEQRKLLKEAQAEHNS